MDNNIKYISFILFFFCLPCTCLSQSWRDRMDSVIYAPKYFGANAFLVPEIHTGKICQEYQFEIRYDYHHAEGDNTQDIFARGYIPFGKKAGLELSGVIREVYHTSEKIKNERQACNTQLLNGEACYGDLIINSMFQLIESEKWIDAMLIAGFKTASGNKLVDARYTDAASYWLNLDFGKNLIQSEQKDKYLRLVGIVGFYCYMTNSRYHRQNDAWMAGGGFESRLKNVYLDFNLRGFQGYKNFGDEPLLLCTKLKYNYKHHTVYFRYQSGLHDYIYQTFSGGYVFSFNL